MRHRKQEADYREARIREKKPFYKRWWFILLVLFFVIGKINSFSGKEKESHGEQILWDEMDLGAHLPEPSSLLADVLINTEEELSLYLYQVSSSDYSSYVKECEKFGYTVDKDRETMFFTAYNEEGYKLTLLYLDDDSQMSLECSAPIAMSEITWPSSTLGQLIPVPKSLIGVFNYEHEKSFSVTVGETPIEDFKEYTEAVSAAGFSVDYSRGDTFYRADNPDGYHISVTYEGNNLMCIKANVPEEGEEKPAEKETEKETAEEKTEETTEEEPGQTSPEQTAEKSEDTANDDGISEDESASAKKDEELADGMRREFKEAMDSYEAFINEYVAFMTKYDESDGNDLSLLTDYASYMAKYADFAYKFEKWEDEDMNDAETNYYIQVQTRVNQKLLEVAVQ